MNPDYYNLKEQIDSFIQHSLQLLKQAKWGKEKISHDILLAIAEEIQSIHSFTMQLIDESKDDTLIYNMQILKGLIEEPVATTKENGGEITLIKAADLAKNEANTECLKQLFAKWSEMPVMSEVLLDDLRQISRELAA